VGAQAGFCRTEGRLGVETETEKSSVVGADGHRVGNLPLLALGFGRLALGCL